MISIVLTSNSLLDYVTVKEKAKTSIAPHEQARKAPRKNGYCYGSSNARELVWVGRFCHSEACRVGIRVVR